MPDENPPPSSGCDLACQTKIIIDGDMVAKVLEVTCEALERFFDKGGNLKHADKLHERLIKLENDAYAFQRAVLESMGYSGPWPKCLS